MKKAAIGMGILLATVLVTAGGDLAPAASTVAQITLPCNTDTVYVDRKSKLMWQDATYTDAEDGAYIRNRSFGKAGTEGYAVQYCQRLSYAGYSDWRLPTADELMAIHHDAGQHFQHFRDRDFWTSTPAVDGNYYTVFPADAYRYARNKRESNYIRCVRCTGK